MFKFLSGILDLNKREIDRLSKIVDRVNVFEVKTKKLKDSDFPKKTEEFKKRITNNEELSTNLRHSFRPTTKKTGIINSAG